MLQYLSKREEHKLVRIQISVVYKVYYHNKRYQTQEQKSNKKLSKGHVTKEDTNGWEACAKVPDVIHPQKQAKWNLEQITLTPIRMDKIKRIMS